MSSDLRYLDSSMLSEDSTLVSCHPELTRKLIPPSSRRTSSMVLYDKKPPCIPPLRTKAMHSRTKEKGAHDDFFTLKEYKNTEIPLRRKRFSHRSPFWFQDVSAQRKRSSYASIEDIKLTAFNANDYNQWFESMLAQSHN